MELPQNKCKKILFRFGFRYNYPNQTYCNHSTRFVICVRHQLKQTDKYYYFLNGTIMLKILHQKEASTPWMLLLIDMPWHAYSIFSTFTATKKKTSKHPAQKKNNKLPYPSWMNVDLVKFSIIYFCHLLCASLRPQKKKSTPPCDIDYKDLPWTWQKKSWMLRRLLFSESCVLL